MVTVNKSIDKKVLIIGGTQMVGRDFVEFCIENSIYPTLANRGLTNKHLFPDLNKIIIDRSIKNKCINLKNNIKYDLVIDFSCYNLKDFVNIYRNIQYNAYIMISTTAVVFEEILKNKNHAWYTYTKNKKLIEEYIEYNNLYNISIVRPCILYGKYDYTNRFYEKNGQIYWKESGKALQQDKYHMSVREFSKYLFSYAFLNEFKNRIIHIDGEGIHHIK